MPKRSELAALDSFLTKGGFSRAATPNGALKRARTLRDAGKRPPQKAKSSSPVDILWPGWDLPKIVAGFSTRCGGASTSFGRKGDLNLGLGRDDRSTVEKNRARFFSAFLAQSPASRMAQKPPAILSLKQVHSDLIHHIQKVSQLKPPLVGDGAVTNLPGVLLSIQVADCVPILLTDPVKRAVGAFHAGWRGTVKRIVEKGVGALRQHFGSDPNDIHAAIGPCIGACCYSVGAEVIEKFHSQFGYAANLFHEVTDDDPVKQKYPLLFLTARAPGHSDLSPQVHLDLVEANRRQLLHAGVPAANIWTSGLCTACRNDLLFSHRREAGNTGRMMALITILRPR